MQAPLAPQPSSKPALRSGIILGIGLGIIHSAIIILTQLTTVPAYYTGNVNTGLWPTTTLTLFLVIPLIWITGFLIAGFIGGKATGKVSTGTLAGLFAGTFGGILAGVGQIITTVIKLNMQTAGNLSQSGQDLLLVTGIFTIIYTLILTIGGGAGVASLGGLLGQSFSNVRPQPAMPQLYSTPVPLYSYMPPQPLSPQSPMPQQPQPPSENITLP